MQKKIIEVEKDIFDNKKTFNIEEFKEWANNIYNEFKDIEDAEIYFETTYEQSFDVKLLVPGAFIKYEREETEEEYNERLKEEEEALNHFYAQKFMTKYGIPNRFGTSGFLANLNDGILKYTIEEFEEFKKNN